MKFHVLVNETAGLKPSQGTTALIASALARGHQVWVSDMRSLSLGPERTVYVRAAQAQAANTLESLVAELIQAPRTLMPLAAGERVLVRTNPGRDDRVWAHSMALELLAIAQGQGVTVLNDPMALHRSMTKLNLSMFPADCSPRSLISRDNAQIRDWVSKAPGRVVLKPLRGTQGRDVFFIDPKAPANLGQIIDVLTRDGAAICQDFMPKASKGDVRLIVLAGEPLQVGGRYAAVGRVPAKGELRSNVALGGLPTAVEPSEALLALGRRAGQALYSQGILLAGLDIISGKIVEANVFSTGGLTDAGAFAGVDFCASVIQAVEQA
jgi:glutathione synthase